MHFKWLCLCESVSVIPCNAYQTGQKDNPLSIPCFNLRLCLRPYHLIFPHDHPPARVPISQPRVNKNHMSHLDVLCFFIRCRPLSWRTSASHGKDRPARALESCRLYRLVKAWDEAGPQETRQKLTDRQNIGSIDKHTRRCRRRRYRSDRRA